MHAVSGESLRLLYKVWATGVAGLHSNHIAQQRHASHWWQSG